MAKPKLPDPKRPANAKTEGKSDMNMMTSIEATATHAAILPSFEPWDLQAWVKQFEAVGGFLTPNGVGWQIYGRSSADQQEARRLFHEADSVPTRIAAIDAYANTPAELDRYYSSLQPQEKIPASRERGRRQSIADPDWPNGVLDLSTGRTLEDAISALDAAASLGLLNYLTTWQWEIADIGSDWQILKHEGEPRVYIGCRCDSQEQERSRRIDALSAHLRSVEGAREALIGIYS